MLNGCKDVTDLPHRTSLTIKIYMRYLEDNEELINVIKNSLGRVSFTSYRQAIGINLIRHWDVNFMFHFQIYD